MVSRRTEEDILEAQKRSEEKSEKLQASLAKKKEEIIAKKKADRAKAREKAKEEKEVIMEFAEDHTEELQEIYNNVVNHQDAEQVVPEDLVIKNNRMESEVDPKTLPVVARDIVHNVFANKKNEYGTTSVASVRLRRMKK